MAGGDLNLTQQDFDDIPQFSIPENDKYDARCGEVFITLNRAIIFHCSFCDNIYGKLSHFLKHISKQHYNKIDESGFKNKCGSKSYGNEFAEDSLSVDELNDVGDESNYPSYEEVVEEFGPEEYEPSIEEDLTGVEQENNGPSQKYGFTEIDITPQEEEFIKEIQVFEIEDAAPFDKTYNDESSDILEIMEECDGDQAIESVQNYSPTSDEVYVNDNTYPGNHYEGKITLENRTDANPKFSCGICPLKFSTSAEVSQHRRIHKAKRPYKCVHCSAHFFTYGGWRGHVRRHSEVPPYKCHCKKRFWNKNDLKEHLLMHAERPLFTKIRNQGGMLRFRDSLS